MIILSTLNVFIFEGLFFPLYLMKISADAPLPVPFFRIYEPMSTFVPNLMTLFSLISPATAVFEKAARPLKQTAQLGG